MWGFAPQLCRGPGASNCARPLLHDLCNRVFFVRNSKEKLRAVAYAVLAACSSNARAHVVSLQPIRSEHEIYKISTRWVFGVGWLLSQAGYHSVAVRLAL